MLGLPEPRVLGRDQARPGARDRKPANVLLVVDTSGSMNDENRLERAKDGARASSSREVAPQDRVGLTIFSDAIQPLVADRRRSQNRQRAARRRSTA